MTKKPVEFSKKLGRALANIGIPGDGNKIVELKAKFINLFHLLFLLGTLFMVLWRLLSGDLYGAGINLILLVPCFLSLAICRSRRHQLALNVLMHIILILDIFALRNGLSVQLILFCAVMPTIAAILSVDKRIPFYYYFISIAMFLGFRIYESQGASTSFIIMMSICFLTSYRFMGFLEKTYADLEKSLREKNDANRDLLLFNEILTHDLKTPLRSINGFAQLLHSEQTSCREKSQEYVQEISRSANSMQNIITDLFNYSQLDQGRKKFTSVDLSSLLKDQIRTFREDFTGLNFEADICNLPIIQGEHNGLRALFNNLISNSLKYQPKDNPNHVPKFSISSRYTEDHLVILFKDNGIGVDEAYADQLFAPFKRLHSSTEYDGTGLGLSICRRVMEKHGGGIFLETGNLDGTTMRLEFPKHLTGNSEVTATA